MGGVLFYLWQSGRTCTVGKIGNDRAAYESSVFFVMEHTLSVSLKSILVCCRIGQYACSAK